MENKLNKKVLIGQLNLRTYTMIIALVILWIVFTIMDSSFLTTRNISNLMRQMSIVGILATGMTLVIITGGIDLSVGSVMGFTSCVAAVMQVKLHAGTLQSILVILAIGVIIGYLQGILVAYTGVPAFIITMGGMLIFRGGILGITRGSTIAPLKKSFVQIGQAYVSPMLGIVLVSLAFIIFVLTGIRKIKAIKESNNATKSISKTVIGIISIGIILFGGITVMNAYRGLPIPVLLMLILVTIYTFIAEKTNFGRRVYAIGGNADAAKYSGINVKKNIAIVYLLSGIMAAVAGIVLAARLSAGTPSAGQNAELDAIAAAVIGGISMTGGVGKVTGAILGALFMATIDNGMSIMNVEAFWQYIVKGCILIFAVWFDVYNQSKKKS